MLSILLSFGSNRCMIPIKPMLAIPGKGFPNKEWIFEPKIDGARCIAYISNNTMELKNRRIDRLLIEESADLQIMEPVIQLG